MSAQVVGPRGVARRPRVRPRPPVLVERSPLLAAALFVTLVHRGTRSRPRAFALSYPVLGGFETCPRDTTRAGHVRVEGLGNDVAPVCGVGPGRCRAHSDVQQVPEPDSQSSPQTHAPTSPLGVAFHADVAVHRAGLVDERPIRGRTTIETASRQRPLSCTPRRPSTTPTAPLTPKFALLFLPSPREHSDTDGTG
jgi:hypothetical protein